MAPGGIFLAAKQGDPALPDSLLQPVNSVEKRPRSLDPRVVHPAIRIVELLRCGSSSQLDAEEQALDPIIRQDSFDISGVEVWGMPGVRSRTDVRHDLDPVPLQQADELLRRMVGMPDRKDRCLPARITAPANRFLALRRSPIVDVALRIGERLCIPHKQLGILLKYVLENVAATLNIMPGSHPPHPFLYPASSISQQTRRARTRVRALVRWSHRALTAATFSLLLDPVLLSVF